MLTTCYKSKWLLLALMVSPGCVSKPAKAPVAKLTLEQWIAAQEKLSWQHLLQNISPKQPKQTGDLRPLDGIVVAGLSRNDPDYYFHWVRDASHVMSVVALHYSELDRPDAQFLKLAGDYLRLSRELQNQKSAFGLAEPRYTVRGKIDPLKWSRPQFDGPALRALSILKILPILERLKETKLIALGEEVLTTDLDFVAAHRTELGFDIWEELKAENFQTRAATAAALTAGGTWIKRHHSPDRRGSRWLAMGNRALAQLDTHWNGKYLRSQLTIEGNDGYTTKKTDLDSAVIIAMLDGGLLGRRDSLDQHVAKTAQQLEELFRKIYPINARSDVGLAYGRYQGDSYFGGNPWPLITAYFARYYYERAVFEPAAEAKGDQIMARLRLHTDADGQLFEQIDKATGEPRSAPGLGWSHAAFLEAAAAKHRIKRIRQDQRLDIKREIELHALAYFLDNVNPKTGMVLDRADNFTNEAQVVASIAATGFGMAVIANASERGMVKPKFAKAYILRSLKFATSKVERYHGWFLHWIDWQTGERKWNSEYSTIDTALFLAGALYSAAVFPGGEIEKLANEIYREVDFNDMLTDGGRLPQKCTLSMGFIKEKGYIPSQWDMYAEQKILLLLGLGHPVHPLRPEAWKEFSRQALAQTAIMGFNEALFVHQYSELFVDFRVFGDTFPNYFENSVKISRFQRELAGPSATSKTLQNGFWGFSAGDAPEGRYSVFSAGRPSSTACISCAVASAMFLPEELLTDMAAWKTGPYAKHLWGRYGFVDSLDLDRDWYGQKALAVTVGPEFLSLANMNESTSVWHKFMTIPAIQLGISRASKPAPPLAMPAPGQIQVPIEKPPGA